MKLRTQPTLVGDPLRPRKDKPVSRAAEVQGHLLHPLKRRGTCPTPSDRVVVIKVWAADLLDLCEHLRGIIRKAHHGPHDVERAGQGSFSAWPVVADDVDDER